MSSVFQLHYLRLPKEIKESHVMLMDATVATGAAAMMAIRVLLDHDVPQENIILLSMLMGDSGSENWILTLCDIGCSEWSVDKSRLLVLPWIICTSHSQTH